MRECAGASPIWRGKALEAQEVEAAGELVGVVKLGRILGERATGHRYHVPMGGEALTGGISQIPMRIRGLLSKSLPGISSEQESAWVKLMAIALAVLCVDAWTKAAIAGSHELGAKDEGGFITILHAQNPGVNYVLHTLGVFPGKIPTLLFLASGVLGCVFILKLALVGRYGWIPAGLGLGGMLGNELDVIAHGYGTDFIYIEALNGTGNVADLALVGALIGLLVLLILDPTARRAFLFKCRWLLASSEASTT